MSEAQLKAEEVVEEAASELLDEAERAKEESEDFAASFAGEETPDREEAQKVEPAEEPAEEVEKIPELTDEQKEEQMLARVEKKLSDRLRSVEGHIGGMKSQIESFKERAKPGQIDLEKVMSGEKMQELKEFLPENYDAIIEALSAASTPAPVDIEALVDRRLEESGKTLETSSAETIKAARDMAQLDRDHPGWESDIQTDKYRNWLSLQENDIIDLALNSKDVNDASKVLSLWEQRQNASNSNLTAQSRQKTTKQERLERAVAPTKGSSTPAPKAAPSEHDEFLAGFNSDG